MIAPSAYLKEWCASRAFLIVRLDTDDDQFSLETSGYIKEFTTNELVLELPNDGEFRLRLFADTTFANFAPPDAVPANIREAINITIAGAVQIKWPGFKLALFLPPSSSSEKLH
jgi:hypothetical protein